MSNDRARFILGSILILGLLALTSLIALGHVEEKSSYGLMGIMGILGKVALDFSEWAFRVRVERREAETKDVSGSVGASVSSTGEETRQ